MTKNNLPNKNLDDSTLPFRSPIRIKDVLAAKKRGEKLAMITAYDSLIASIFDQVDELDMILVGDSMGNVSLGYETTLNVTLEQMCQAVSAVARVVERLFVVADMPFGSYEESDDKAFQNAARLIRSGAKAVKIEGAWQRESLIKKLTNNAIAVMGHLGYTPQSVHTLSGPSLQRKDEIIEQAKILEQAGAFAIVLEMVPSPIAEEITKSIQIPTIGIGAGPHVDGQVLVWSDLAGMHEWSPFFAKQYANLGIQLFEAASQYAKEVKNLDFPSKEYYRQ